MAKGLLIAKTDKKLPASKDEDLVFSSESKTLMIVKHGVETISLSAWGGETLQIQHGLEFIPYFGVYYKSSIAPSKWQWYPQGGMRITDNIQLNLIGDAVRIDKNNLYLRFSDGTGLAQTITVKYYLLNVRADIN